MNLSDIRLQHDMDKSFIVYRENKPFDRWHFHPEYELVYILNGCGKRMIGDHVDRFRNGDLIFMGSNLPHEWHCDNKYYQDQNIFLGEGLVIQFLYDFLGDKFFEIPENQMLKEFFRISKRGIEFFGKTKQKIISLMMKLETADSSDRLFYLFSLFRIFSHTEEYRLLSSPAYIEPSHINHEKPMQKALKYILENFQSQIYIDDLIEILNMSNTAFYMAFKNSYKVSFKQYLLNLRIGYACKLLTEGTKSVTEIAFESGFQNISNFNRQFKKIRGLTPTKYMRKIHKERDPFEIE